MDRFDVASDREIALGKGAEVEVALSETPTSGYRWTAAADAAVVAITDLGLVSDGASIGAGGRHVFRVRGLNDGRHDLTLRLARSWEASPLRQHRVTLVVR